MSVPATNEAVVSDLPPNHWLFKVKSVMLKTIIISITILGIIAGVLAMIGNNGSIILQLFQTVSVITLASIMIIVDAGLIAKKKDPVFILFGLASSVLWLAIGVYKIWIQPLIEVATRPEMYAAGVSSEYYYSYAEFFVNIYTLGLLFGIFRLYVFILQLVINVIKESKISFVKNIAKTVTIPLMTLATILITIPLTITLTVVPFEDGYWRITTGGIILAFVGFFVVFLSSRFFDERKPKPAKVQPQQPQYYYPQQGQQPQAYENYPQYGQPQQLQNPFYPNGQPVAYPQQPVAQPPAGYYEQPVSQVVPQPPAPQGGVEGSNPPPPPAPPVDNRYVTPPPPPPAVN